MTQRSGHMVHSTMTKRRCEQCENCFGHVSSDYCGKTAKDCNRAHVPVLLTCAKCKEIRYCSRICQKAHWKEHKSTCLSHIGLLAAVKLYGPRVEHTFKAFCKFAQTVSSYLEVPAISALELHKGIRRINSHVFFIRIKAKETIFHQTKKTTRGVITFTLVSAECRTMDQMHAFLDWRSGPFATPAVTEHTLAHRPGLLRIFVLDTSGLLPIPLDGYTLPTDVSGWPGDYHEKYDEDWFEHLLESIGQPTRDPPVEEVDVGSEFFESFSGPPIPPARPSSPVSDLGDDN